MSLKEKKLIETNKYELLINIDRPAFDAAVNEVFKKQSKNITIPGFRRGKAPRAIIEKMYGSGVFYEDAVNDLLPDAYEKAAAESELEIVSRPEIDIDTIDENGVTVKAVVYVKPEVKIDGYKGLAATKKAVTVEDSEIDAEIDRVRERNARIEDVEDRPAADGDIANIDFEGFVDGVAFEGGKAEGHELTLGSGSFIPGFEEQIVGKNIGEEFDVNVTFPEDYHAEELKGKASVFKVKLNALKKKELPAVDDELATMVSEFNTLDEYKADIKAKITDRKEKAADNEVEEQLVDALIDLMDAEIPECMYDEEAENCLRDMDNNLRMQGLDLKTYFQYTGMDLDSARAEMRPRAIKQVKTRLALEAVAKLENIEATDEELEEEIKRMAEAYKVDIEEVRKLIPADGVKEDIKVKKAVDFIKAEAKITAEGKKAPAKRKAPAKKDESKAADADGKKDSEEKAPAKKAPAKRTTTAKTAAKSDEKKAPAKKPAKKDESDSSAAE